MPGQIPCGDIHHLRLTVTDVQRSREFYTGLLGFQVAVESPPPDDPAAAEAHRVLFGGVVMIRGNLIMGLRPMAPAADHFDPDRVGLDHLSFGVAGREDLEQAVGLFDERGVAHGEPFPELPTVSTHFVLRGLALLARSALSAAWLTSSTW